ncbi:unnamed protein product, partial [marine sediment metagenome]
PILKAILYTKKVLSFEQTTNNYLLSTNLKNRLKETD